MTGIGTITWRGKSGRKYEYLIYRIETTLDPVPGNFVLADETSPGLYLPIYVGQTGDLSGWSGTHDAMQCSRRNRATFIHVHLHGGGEEARLEEEADLIAHWNPPCNRAHVPVVSRAGLFAP